MDAGRWRAVTISWISVYFTLADIGENMIIRWLVTFLVKLSPLYFLIAATKEIGWAIAIDTKPQ